MQAEEEDIDLSDHLSLAKEGDESLEQGDYQIALGLYMLAMQAAPQETAYRLKFIVAAKKCEIHQFNENIFSSLLACLQDEQVDCTKVQRLWATQLAFIDPFRSFLTYDKENGFSFDEPAFDRAKNLDSLNIPYFTLGLKKVMVYNPEFEYFLTYLRKTLLLQMDRFTPHVFETMAAAMSHYCLYTEYAFAVSESEQKAIDVLEGARELTVAQALQLACYRPLIEKADAVKDIPLPLDVRYAQIDERRELADISKDIPSITDIDEGVSQKVRAQYEESPYPRWRTLPKPYAESFAKERMNQPGMKILVAGCGTGLEPVQFSLMFPKAEILAIDLSRASMAYALRKTREFGLKNINFAHGDILKLGTLNEKFDIVSSSGVLHHMQDPMQGWRVLVGLLKDDGLMRIGLYSKTARKFVVEARKVIQEKGYAPNVESMRRFRQNAKSLLSDSAYQRVIMSFDYYHLPTIRDLLFHVQEHTYEPRDLKKMLDELDLAFVQFAGIPVHLQAAYKKSFPRDKIGNDLENWQVFEKAHPNMFANMFQFWCVRKTALLAQALP